MEINYPPATETWMCALTDSWGCVWSLILEDKIRTEPLLSHEEREGRTLKDSEEG